MTEPVTATPPTDESPPTTETRRTTGGPLFWVGVVVGWTVIALGIRGLLQDHVDTNPTFVGRQIIGAALILDLIVAPLVCAVGLLVSRLLKPPVRAIVGGGIVSSTLITAYSFPFVRGYGRSPNLPSALPINYGRGLLIVLAGIWVVVAALCTWSLRRSRAETPQATP